MPPKKTTNKMREVKASSTSPRSYMARNRMVNKIRKSTKHLDMGVYAKKKSPATRPKKA